jgi:hypothetical protein
MEIRHSAPTGTRPRRRPRRRSEERDTSSAEQEQADTDGQQQENDQGVEMSEQRGQGTTATNGTDMSQQLMEALQPIIGDLQEQITQTVQQQFGQASSDGAGALSLDNLPVGDTLRSTLEAVIEQLHPIIQWVLQIVQKLVSWIMGLFGGDDAERDAEAAASE